MVYFKNEKLRFPRHFGLFSGKLKLINGVTKEETELTVTDISDDNRFYEFDLSNLSLSAGTYTYKIGDDYGLMQVGDYQIPAAQKTVYEENKTNVVYER